MNFSIESLLAKYKNLKNPKEDKIKIAKIITGVLGFEVTEDKVSVTKNILNLKLDSYIKTEVFMKQEKILEELNKEKFFITSIR